jgi:type IV pilus assembly protein PilE
MMRSTKNGNAGFTLIELMVVAAIIAILMAIAIPSYRRYVVRSNRVDAQRALMDLAARQERAFYSKNQYVDLATLGGNSSVAGPNYSVSVVASSSSTAYTLTASAVGKQKTSDAQCQTITVSNTGAQGSSGTTANDPACWSK